MTLDPKDIPGLAEAGWLEEMDKLAQNRKEDHIITLWLRYSVKFRTTLLRPFAVAVNKEEVPDYYRVIEHPIDLATIEQKLENNLYLKFTDFVDDLKLMFNNCRAYNSETTTYYKNANKLEKFMNNKLKDCSFV